MLTVGYRLEIIVIRHLDNDVKDRNQHYVIIGSINRKY